MIHQAIDRFVQDAPRVSPYGLAGGLAASLLLWATLIKTAFALLV